MKYDYVIVGLGNTGLSCAKHLARLNFTFAITDSRDAPPGLDEFTSLFPDAPLALGQFDQAMMLSAKELVVSQGVSYQHPTLINCQQAGIPLIGDLELFVRYVKAPIIAITGSNGKSTVTTLVGEMLVAAGKSVKVGGNLGIPALDLISSIEPDYYVLEVSNFQLEMTTDLHAEVACVLNISPDHLDRYATFNDYILTKQRVYFGCKKAVINRDDKLTALPSHNKAEVVSFGSDTPAENQFGLIKADDGQTYLTCGKEKLLDVNQLKIKGRHNWLNALSALAIASQASVPLAPLLDVLKTFAGLSHRCQWVREINGVDWYNDSKGTNIGATIAAIAGLGSAIQGKIILLAGGLGKGADFTELQPVVRQFVRHVILFGQDAALISQGLGDDVSKIFARDFNEAINQAAQLSVSGDTVLLSPACASWDMFKNFEHRGQVFCELVRNLSTEVM
ncbi:MAG: UDP-N-acetylmuramoyl-L-alanine--D-glutamate ligase [Legionellales bacterium]|nr:UDP-N-acetylmuramoyl-L-alanine--D-glutamate ligase [Legionellales bacterium]